VREAAYGLIMALAIHSCGTIHRRAGRGAVNSNGWRTMIPIGGTESPHNGVARRS